MANRKRLTFKGRSICFLLTLVFLLGIWKTAVCAQAIENIVDEFFPETLIRESLEESEQGGADPFKAFDFVAADLAGTGRTDFIIAAYTNGVSAAIRVLRRQGSAFVLADEPNFPTLTGAFPEVNLLDLDGDKRPEIIASFSDARGSTAEWVFKWNGTSLELVSPPPVDANGNFSVALVNSDFVDLDRDGRLEVVSARQVNGERIFDVFGFDGIHFAPRQSLNFFGTFFRHSGAPDLTTEVFNVGRTDLAYMVRILNGDDAGMNRVSSAVISLNGVVLAGPERFNQQVAEILIPVNLQASNELMVELRGGPGGEITVLIEPRQ